MTTSSADDCRFVGKKEILNSPRVKAAPPSVNRPIPVPSVYVDDRGEIHNLQVGGGGGGGGNRINILFSKKGVMRSGDIHENTQHDFVFKGSVEVWRLQATSNSPEEGGGGSRGGGGGGGDDDNDDDNDDHDGTTIIMRITEKKIYNSYEYIRIEPFVPHVFHFLEDTVMAEWWEPQGFYAWFYEPYRKIVQESFNKTTSKSTPGRFRLLKEDNNNDEGGEGGQTTKAMLAHHDGAAMMIATSGLFAIGLGIGYILGQRKR